MPAPPKGGPWFWPLPVQPMLVRPLRRTGEDAHASIDFLLYRLSTLSTFYFIDFLLYRLPALSIFYFIDFLLYRFSTLRASTLSGPLPGGASRGRTIPLRWCTRRERAAMQSWPRRRWRGIADRFGP